MTSISIEEAQAKLPQIIQQLRPGEEITITDRGAPLAQVRRTERTRWPCRAGCYRKPEFRMSPDFDAPLD